MTREEIIVWQAEEKKFSSTAVGRALNKFRLAHASVIRDEFADNASYTFVKRRDDEYKAAEKALKEEIKRLLAKAEEY